MEQGSFTSFHNILNHDPVSLCLRRAEQVLTTLAPGTGSAALHSLVNKYDNKLRDGCLKQKKKTIDAFFSAHHNNVNNNVNEGMSL